MSRPWGYTIGDYICSNRLVRWANQLKGAASLIMFVSDEDNHNEGFLIVVSGSKNVTWARCSSDVIEHPDTYVVGTVQAYGLLPVGIWRDNAKKMLNLAQDMRRAVINKKATRIRMKRFNAPTN